MLAMFGWFSDARRRASRSRRSSLAGWLVNASGSTLIATSRCSRVSRARYTSPIPPRPSSATISNGPTGVPGASIVWLTRSMRSSARLLPRGRRRILDRRVPVLLYESVVHADHVEPERRVGLRCVVRVHQHSFEHHEHIGAAHDRDGRLVLPLGLDRFGLANAAEELDERGPARWHVRIVLNVGRCHGLLGELHVTILQDVLELDGRDLEVLLLLR